MKERQAEARDIHGARVRPDSTAGVSAQTGYHLKLCGVNHTDTAALLALSSAPSSISHAAGGSLTSCGGSVYSEAYGFPRPCRRAAAHDVPESCSADDPCWGTTVGGAFAALDAGGLLSVPCCASGTGAGTGRVSVVPSGAGQTAEATPHWQVFGGEPAADMG